MKFRCYRRFPRLCRKPKLYNGIHIGMVPPIVDFGDVRKADKVSPKYTTGLCI
jgi:hypothetical protein